MEPLSKEFICVSLNTLSDSKYGQLRALVEEQLAYFQCSNSEHHQEFARTKLLTADNNGISRSYVIIHQGSDLQLSVAAYFIVGLRALSLQNLSKSQRTKLMGNWPSNTLGAYYIAELARSDNFSSKDLSGTQILDSAIGVVRSARALIGGRMLMVDSKELVYSRLYSPVGFTKIGSAPGPIGSDQELVTSVLMYKKIDVTEQQ